MAKEKSQVRSSGHDNKYMSIGAAAKYLGVSIDTVRRWEQSDKLTGYRLDGRNRYFLITDLDAIKSVKPLTTSQVAKLLNISASTVRRLEQQGTLVPHKNQKGRRSYPAALVADYLTQTEKTDKPVVVSKEQATRVVAPAIVPKPTRVKVPMSAIAQIVPVVTQPKVVHHVTPEKVVKARRSRAPRESVFARAQRRRLVLAGGYTRGALAVGLLIAVILIVLAIKALLHQSAEQNLQSAQNAQSGAGTAASIQSVPLNLPNNFLVSLPGSGLTVAVTNGGSGANVQGGSSAPAVGNGAVQGGGNDAPANFPDLPLTSKDIADGTLGDRQIAAGGISLVSLSPELKTLVTAERVTQLITNTFQTTTVAGKNIIAGIGLSGSANGNDLTLGINLGTTLEAVNNNLEVRLANGTITSTTSSGSGLERTADGLQLLGGCGTGQTLSWSGTAWQCATVSGGGGGVSLDVKEDATTVTPGASALSFSATEFAVSNAAGQANIAIDYLNSGIARTNTAQTITGSWTFNDNGFTLRDDADNTKRAAFQLSGIATGTIHTFTVPNVDGTLITTGNLSGITSVGTITSGTWQGSAVGVQYGGTGATTFTTRGIVYGNGTSALQATAAGTSGQMLVANGSGVPAFVTLSGDGTLAANGTLTIGNAAISNANLENNWLMVSAGTNLTGGGTVALGGTVSIGLGAAVTTQGNTFNGASQLVQLDASGRLPAIDGSQLTNLPVSGPGGTLSVSGGGTGATSFTAQGLLYGNGTGAIQATAAGLGGQLVIGNNSGNPIFATLTGDASLAANGALTVANGVITNGKLANSTLTVSPGNGLSGGGLVALGGSTSLNVTYGSAANTAVQGNTTLVCPSGGTGLTGGGNTITLGSGGTCGALNLSSSPTFSGTVTAGTLMTSTITSAGALSIASSGASNDLSLAAGSGSISVAASQFTSNNSLRFDMVNAGNTTLTVQNSGGGVANFNLNGGSLLTAGTVRLSNSGVLQNVTGDNTDGVSFNANVITAGSISDALLSSNVTLAGNSFNGASQLVQLDGSGFLPALDGSQLTNVAASSFSGTLSVANGGTGAGSFMSKALVYGNGTGALQQTNVGTSGQLLLANATGVPTFTTISGDITFNGSGVATIGAGTVTNAKLANSAVTVSAGTGLSGGGSVSLGGSTSLSVNYGNTSTSAVRGDRTIVCPSGSGNLSGGGTTIILGDGGTCAGLTMVAAPSFTGVTVSSFTSAGVVKNNASGVLSSGLVSLGTDTTGAYVSALGTLTGLTAGGTASVPTLSVNYGNTSTSAVRGDRTIVCPSGSGAGLSGGGNTITLGDGGTCSGLTMSSSPTFTNITASTIAGSAGLSITSTGGATSINTTGTSATAIGNATGTFSVTSNAINISTAGAVTGVTNLTGSGTVQGATLNATSALQLNGANIDTAGTLTNVAYKNAANTFSAAGTALTVSNDALISGTATNGTLSVTNNASIGGTTTATGLATFNGGVSVANNSNLLQSGTGTFGTGTGAVSLNGATSVTGANTFTVGTGATTLGGTLNVTGATTLAGLSVSSLRVGTSTTAGFILTADAAGNATWQAPQISQVYNGTTLTSGNTKIWTGSATVTTGVATIFLTDNGVTGGNAIFSNIYSVQVTHNGGTTAATVYYGNVRSYTPATKALVVTLTSPGGAGAAQTTAPTGQVAYVTVIGN